VSFAADHPVSCCRAGLGCTASHPGGKWAAVKADADGWFHSKAEDQAYCPDHIPDWVSAWRARQKVERTFEKLPSQTACAGCGFSEVVEEDTSEALSAQRRRAADHVVGTRHVVTVSTFQRLTLEPGEAPVDA
jgi:hypothetical protein